MKTINPEIKIHIDNLSDEDSDIKELLSKILIFEQGNSDKSNYAFKQQILDEVERLVRERNDKDK